jgi:hypothetical protein
MKIRLQADNDLHEDIERAAKRASSLPSIFSGPRNSTYTPASEYGAGLLLHE